MPAHGNLVIIVRQRLDWTIIELQCITKNPTEIHKICTLRFNSGYADNILERPNIQKHVKQLIAQAKELIATALSAAEEDDDKC